MDFDRFSSNNTLLRLDKTISELSNKFFYESVHNQDANIRCFKNYNKRTEAIFKRYGESLECFSLSVKIFRISSLNLIEIF